MTTALLRLSDLDPPIALLRMIDKGCVDYLELTDSIAANGVLNSILVRPSPTDSSRFQIVDGLYRFSACEDLGLETIPAVIKSDISDEDVLVLQLEANGIGKITEPTEYASRLRRLLAQNPEMTLSELGGRIHKSPTWIKDRLSLLKLDPKYQKHVDRGEMPLGSAVMLSKLPPKFQPEFVESALVMKSKDFKLIASEAITRYREAVRQGKLDRFYTEDWKPVAHLRTLNEVNREIKEHEAGPIVVLDMQCRTPIEGFYAALQWLTHLDPRSVEAQKRQHYSRTRNKETKTNE